MKGLQPVPPSLQGDIAQQQILQAGRRDLGAQQRRDTGDHHRGEATRTVSVPWASGIQGLARFFRHLDRDGSRSLDAEELRRGLAQLGPDMNEVETKAVCERWERDGNGTLDLEFLRALQPPMSQAWDAVIAAAFAKLDKTGDGTVTVDDLRGVYSARAHPKVRGGERTEDEALRSFLDTFDTRGQDGQVNISIEPLPECCPGLGSLDSMATHGSR